MDLGLGGRRALVSGSSSGIGAAIAVMLAGEGVEVVVHGRDRARTDRVVDLVVAAGGTARAAIGDLSTDDGADAVAAAAGPVDILVNNAGFYESTGWMDTTAQAWLDIYDTNVVSGVRLIQRLVPAMRERAWGRVITIGAGFAIEPAELQPHYSAASAARHNLSTSLARELARTGVTSNVVAPGPIVVDATRRLFTPIAEGMGLSGPWDQIEPELATRVFDGDVDRFGRPEEVAAAVCFVASEHAGYLSGATLRIDGGILHSAF